MRFPYTGVILAGGLATRFSGKNKAFIQIGGQPILQYIVTVFQELFEEIILVTNDPLDYADWDLQIVTDHYKTRSSLTGLHTGLFYATRAGAFFSASDTPFIKRELIVTILESFDHRTDVVIPQTQAGHEPLCAMYSKACLKPMEWCLNHDHFKIQNFFDRVRVKRLPESVLRQGDPDLVSFFNINTPEDLEKANQIFSGDSSWT